MNTISLNIDDRKITATAGQTILEVCRQNNIEILTMCHLKGLEDIGACRLCMVEIEGNSRLMAACTTRAAENMIVKTKTEKIQRYQRITAELFFAERNHMCAVCVANGNCELQNLGYKVGLDSTRYPHLYPHCNIDTSHEYFVLDHNRCIMCTRCVRVCKDVEGAYNWDIKNRGYQVRIISDFDTPWGESTTCTSCGKCVQACPTGALWSKSVVQGQMNKCPEMITDLVERRKMNL